MNSNRTLDKAKNVYKNHGVRGVIKKTRSTTKFRIKRFSRNVLRLPRLSLEQKQLEEEYIFASSPIFQITSKDIKLSQASKQSKPKEIKSALWFIPYFDHIAFGGIQTIFRLVQKLGQEDVKNYLVIYDNPAVDTSKIKQQIASHFPDLTNYELIVFEDDKLSALQQLPEVDIAFCTMWVSAYLLLRFNKTKRKYYFIQDYEPFFYVAGSTFALAESTYRFGFEAIVNTPGLLAAINQRHGLEGISFIPSVNHDLYYPAKHHNQKVRIFFYARPMNPRNAFNLGVLTIQHLIEEYGDRIEIITAGAKWDEGRYQLAGKITNLGLIQSIEEVAELYRNCDIGFAFMLNKHTSYQMLEYSASGMATVMNYNEDHLWLYKDGVNCLLAEPSPADMAQKIGKLIKDQELRHKLVDNAQKELVYTWDQQLSTIWNDIKKS